MAKIKIRKGDNVKIIAGNDKGKTGRVLLVEREKNRVIVEGVRIVSKHTKPSADNPINISNVMLLDGSGEASRVGRKLNDKGQLQRYSKKTGEFIKDE